MEMAFGGVATAFAVPQRLHQLLTFITEKTTISQPSGPATPEQHP